MADIMMPIVSYKEIGEKGARYALDEVEYNGLTIRQWADKITSGEYAPVVHGQWDDSFDGITPVCSVCGRTHKCFNRTPNYCPNCGAKMDE